MLQLFWIHLNQNQNSFLYVPGTCMTCAPKFAVPAVLPAPSQPKAFFYFNKQSNLVLTSRRCITFSLHRLFFILLLAGIFIIFYRGIFCKFFLNISPLLFISASCFFHKLYYNFQFEELDDFLFCFIFLSCPVKELSMFSFLVCI